MKRSITWQLAAMFALATLATFAAVGGVLYGVLHAELLHREDDQLRTHLQSLRYSIERVDSLERWHRVVARMDTLTPADGSVRFWVLSADPRFQYGTDPDALRAAIGADGAAVVDRWRGPGHALRTLSTTIAPLAERPVVRLVVGVDTGFYGSTLRTFSIAYAAVAAVASLAIAAMGFLIARLGLRPLRRLSAAVQHLQPNRPSQRLATEALPAELQHLAIAFNGALARLEDAYRQLEAFNADVAHELRTPLANLIGGTQVALSRPRGAPQFQEALQSNLEELERLRSIVNDMLFLARADRGEAATALVEALVADEVRKTVEFFEFVLDDRQLQVRMEGDLLARATLEKSLFRRAMSNLLQNAVSHAPAGSDLVVRIAQQADAVWVTVSNRGETVGQTHLQRLFDRFYRIDPARSDAGEPHGFGLGLAIVKAIARMHGGSVSAASRDGLTTIGFSLQVA